MRKGDNIGKRNFTTFSGKPYITVETADRLPEGLFRINGRYVVNPDNVKILTEEETSETDRIWNDSGILSDHVEVEGRIPCSRSDGASKQPVPEKDMQAKLYEIRMKRNDLSFQAYRCPDCGNLHIGRNPFVPKDRI